MALALRDAGHEGICQIQRIFIEKKSRLFHWVTDRRIPAENNFAERELRPSVIARKVSFGSQSARGTETRGNLMSLLHTVRKRVKDRPPEEWLKEQPDCLVACPAIERRLATTILESRPDH
jgi:AraC-like DNA-binding protein